MTHLSRHSVVAPILTAPLLTDTCRSTVGPGTREDIVVTVCSFVMVTSYLPLPRSSSCSTAAPVLAEEVFCSWSNCSTCSSGGAHRVSSAVVAATTAMVECSASPQSWSTPCQYGNWSSTCAIKLFGGTEQAASFQEEATSFFCRFDSCAKCSLHVCLRHLCQWCRYSVLHKLWAIQLQLPISTRVQ